METFMVIVIIFLVGAGIGITTGSYSNGDIGGIGCLGGTIATISILGLILSLIGIFCGIGILKVLLFPTVVFGAIGLWMVTKDRNNHKK